MGNLAVMAQVLKNKAEELTKQDRPRVDNNLPLGLRIGTFLTISADSDFILYEDSLLTKNPGSEHIVVAIGKFSIDSGIDVYRFYLQSTDEHKEESILQVSMEGANPAEFAIYRLYDSIDPQSPEEFSHWLDKPNGLIGYKDFNVEDGKYVFIRDINQGKDWSDPMEFVESVIYDKFGDKGVVCNTKLGYFVRDLGGINEMLIIEHDKMRDKDRNLLSSRIGLLTGIEISPAQLVVKA